MKSGTILSQISVLALGTCVVAAGPKVIFFDDFEGEDSHEAGLTKNATSKVYKTNSLLEGHLLKKWNYGWNYSYFEGDWEQAFYVVEPGGTELVQAGRSGAYRSQCPNRITAKAEIPEEARKYRIELKQFKADNDQIYYLLGAGMGGFDGVEIGYDNQLPGTDETVDDAFIRGNVIDGLILPGRSYLGEWVKVCIDVDVEAKRIDWTMDGQPFLSASVPGLKPGGYFGIYMHYERGTRYDDVRISILE